LAEGLLRALADGPPGLVLGAWILQGLVAMLPAEVRLMTHVGLDPAVVAFTAGLSLASAIVFGLVPAIQQSRPALVPSLKEGGLVRGASRAHRRLKNALVVSEVALSLVLTAGTGLLLRSFWNLAHAPGVQSAGAISWAPMGLGSATTFRVLDRPVPPRGQEPVADIRIVTPGLLRTMGVPVLAGATSWPATRRTGRASCSSTARSPRTSGRARTPSASA
jgi:putative ABC transport system permease protein